MTFSRYMKNTYKYLQHTKELNPFIDVRTGLSKSTQLNILADFKSP